MEHFILIRGPLGIGKTTIARKLAHALNGEYVSVDLFLEKLGLDKVQGDSIPLKNFIKANELIIPYARKKLAKHETVIVDGNFYFKEQIEHLVKNVPARTYAFTIKAPLRVCIQRDGKRKMPYGKGSVEAVYRLVSRFDYGIPIDAGNKTPARVVKNILSCLPRKS
jgi:uridine kinase